MSTRTLWHAGLACLVSMSSAVALAQASRTPPATSPSIAPANAGANAGSGGSAAPNSSDAQRSGATERDHVGGAKGPAYPASQPRSKLPGGKAGNTGDDRQQGTRPGSGR